MKGKKKNKNSTTLSHTQSRMKSKRATLSIYGWVRMEKSEYIKTLQRINEQIARYLENWFTQLNPRQHLFELIGWRNKLTYSINIEEDLKAFKQSWDEYKLLYVGNLREFWETKWRIWNTKTLKSTKN